LVVKRCQRGRLASYEAQYLFGTRSQDRQRSDEKNIRGETSLRWLPGGFFLEQRARIDFIDQQIDALELIGYDPESDTFPSTVYSGLSSAPLPYRWDARGDEVTISVSYGALDATFTGSWREDGTFSGGWRPNPGADETILREPDVAAWWDGYEPDPKRIVEELMEEPDTVALAIEVDGEPVGLIQYEEENTPDYRHASIDIFLATTWQGRGLGTEALRLLARYLFEERGHHRLTIDPAAANTRAIRAYEKVGFRPVGVMRQYERGLTASGGTGF
jgi:aminoglycoside 6'-N-acetyltransferase